MSNVTISEFINKNRKEMLDDLKEIVNVYSGTYMPEGTTKVANILGEKFRALGATVNFRDSDQFGTHLVATIGPAEGEKVFVAGHIDTVFEGEDNWEFSISNGKAFGPGVIDMKSGALTFLWALRAMQEVNSLNKNYTILLNTDEEPGSPESRDFIGELAEGCEYALVMEPAEPTGEILNGRKGVGIFHFEITGLSAHAGQEPEKGASAISAAAQLIQEIGSVANKKIGTTVNVGIINGGTAVYAVPASCNFSVDVRVPTTDEADRVAQEFKDLATQFTKDRVTVDLQGSFHRAPMVANNKVVKLVKQYQQAAKKHGIDITAKVSGAASDGNTLAEHGLSVLDGLGPVGGRAHSSEEYMEVETYFERTTILAEMLSENNTVSA